MSYALQRFLEWFPDPIRALMIDDASRNNCQLAANQIFFGDSWKTWQRLSLLRPRWTHLTWIDKSTDPETRTTEIERVLVDLAQLEDRMVSNWARLPVVWIATPPWAIHRGGVRKDKLFASREEAERDLAVQALAGTSWIDREDP